MSASSSSASPADPEARSAFIELTGASELQANSYLQTSSNNLEVAVALYYEDCYESHETGERTQQATERRYQDVKRWGGRSNLSHGRGWRGIDSWWESDWSGWWSNWDWSGSTWAGTTWAADDRIGFYDTDGDYCEYVFSGSPGKLDVLVNGKFIKQTTWIEYMVQPLRKCYDASGSLTIPEKAYRNVVQGLESLCSRAEVRCETRNAPEGIPWGPAQPRSFCIRLTVGALVDYNRESLLHVGISDSSGRVAHFPADVVHHRDVWLECISVSLPLSELQDTAWDSWLSNFVAIERERLKTEPYSSLGNNCFSFCARFFNHISYAGLSSHSKEEIVTQHGIAQAIEQLEEFLAKLQAGVDVQ